VQQDGRAVRDFLVASFALKEQDSQIQVLYSRFGLGLALLHHLEKFSSRMVQPSAGHLGQVFGHLVRKLSCDLLFDGGVEDYLSNFRLVQDISYRRSRHLRRQRIQKLRD